MLEHDSPFREKVTPLDSWGDFIQEESLLTECVDTKVGLADEGRHWAQL